MQKIYLLGQFCQKENPPKTISGLGGFLLFPIISMVILCRNTVLAFYWDAFFVKIINKKTMTKDKFMEKSGISKQSYNSIDLMKFIMAFAVVALHIRPLENYNIDIVNKLYNIFTLMAVPFFFLSSGFLLASKMQWPYGGLNDLIRIKHQLSRIIQLYIIWTIIYFPLAIYHFVDKGYSLLYSILLYIRGVFLTGQNYNSWQLWYLLSTIYTLLIIYLIIKRSGSIKSLIPLIVVASFISIGIDILMISNGSLSSEIALIRKLITYSIGSGRIFSGLIYIPIGMIMFHKRLPHYINWLLLIGSSVARFFIVNEFITGYLIVFSSIGLFGIIISISLHDSLVYPILRNMSTIVYLIHMYIWTVYYMLIYGEKTYGLDSFIVVSLVSSIFAILYSRIKVYRKHLVFHRRDR